MATMTYGLGTSNGRRPTETGGLLSQSSANIPVGGQSDSNTGGGTLPYYTYDQLNKRANDIGFQTPRENWWNYNDSGQLATGALNSYLKSLEMQERRSQGTRYGVNQHPGLSQPIRNPTTGVWSYRSVDSPARNGSYTKNSIVAYPSVSDQLASHDRRQAIITALGGGKVDPFPTTVHPGGLSSANPLPAETTHPLEFNSENGGGNAGGNGANEVVAPTNPVNSTWNDPGSPGNNPGGATPTPTPGTGTSTSTGTGTGTGTGNITSVITSGTPTAVAGSLNPGVRDTFNSGVASNVPTAARASAATGVSGVGFNYGSTVNAPSVSSAKAAMASRSEDALVENRMKGLLSKGGDWKRLAEQHGLDMANKRGVLNSSIGASAAYGEAIKAALPISQQDARTTSTYDLADQANTQQTALANAGAENTASNLTYKTDRDIEGSLQRADQGFQHQGSLNSQNYSNQANLVRQQSDVDFQKAAQEATNRGLLAEQGYGFDSSLRTQQAGIDFQKAEQDAINRGLLAEQGYGFETGLQSQKMDDQTTLDEAGYAHDIALQTLKTDNAETLLELENEYKNLIATNSNASAVLQTYVNEAGDLLAVDRKFTTEQLTQRLDMLKNSLEGSLGVLTGMSTIDWKALGITPPDEVVTEDFTPAAPDYTGVNILTDEQQAAVQSYLDEQAV